eukprot:GEMP01006476.1.p1 GENE.GEMP01006476.1~~GEMP01006476.1.p1  ORF type:complete len:534 (+),score=144.25 GEMP01006476.1:257-1858(+)
MDQIGFQVMLEGDWCDYPPQASKLIRDAYNNGEKKTNLKVQINDRPHELEIDFEKMKQISAYSGKQHDIRPPWDLLKQFNADAADQDFDTGFDDCDQKYAGKGNQDIAKARKMVFKVLEKTRDLKGKDEPTLSEWKDLCQATVKDVVKMGLHENELRPLRDRTRKIHNAVQDLKGAIRCYVRTRPQNQRELDNQSRNCLNFAKDRMVLCVESDDGEKNMFTFDTTFNPGNQKEIFAELEDLCQSVYDGFNVCVFAYGQTGSGKTFTMYGPASDIKKDPGVVVRAIDELFRLKKDVYPPPWNAHVSVSMVELYCGTFTDLLANDVLKGPKVAIKRAQDGEVLLDGSNVLECKDSAHLWSQIQRGFANRKTAATAMNSESSRSHLILTIKVLLENTKTNVKIKGKMTMVDLAGSERVKQSQVEGQALKEAIEINKSLTSLGNVMEQLTTGKKNVSYREHLLTQVLQDSLGGTAKTLMFANVSPASINYGETIMTCKWATRARNVVNLGGAPSPTSVASPKAGASPGKKPVAARRK